MNNPGAIRKLVLSGHSDYIRTLLLTKDQTALLKYINRIECITTAELSHYLNISVQNASSKLRRLHQSGYLLRISETQLTGGIEYAYHRRYYE